MHHRFSRFVSLGLVCILMLALVAVAGAQDDLKIIHTGVNMVGGDPDTIDPGINEASQGNSILSELFPALTRQEETTGEVLPGMAESWEVSEDGLTYTFHLRDGVLFHESEGVTYESREVSAEDIVWNYEMALNADTEISIHAEGMTSIKGAAAFTAGETDVLEGVQALDEDTVQITLEVPDRLFLINGILSIISP